MPYKQHTCVNHHPPDTQILQPHSTASHVPASIKLRKQCTKSAEWVYCIERALWSMVQDHMQCDVFHSSLLFFSQPMCVAAMVPFVVTMTAALGCLSPSTVTSWGDWICSVCEGSRRGGALGRGEEGKKSYIGSTKNVTYFSFISTHMTGMSTLPANVQLVLTKLLAALWELACVLVILAVNRV